MMTGQRDRNRNLSGCSQPGCCQAAGPTATQAADLRLGYGLPLVMMLAASGLAAALGHGDGLVGLAAVIGLASGAWLAGHRRRRRDAGHRPMSPMPAVQAAGADRVRTRDVGTRGPGLTSR